MTVDEWFALAGIPILGAVFYWKWRDDKRQKAKREAELKGGMLACPFCEHLIADHVRYMAQQVTCPQCSSQFQAPGRDVVLEAGIAANTMIAVVAFVVLLLVIFLW